MALGDLISELGYTMQGPQALQQYKQMKAQQSLKDLANNMQGMNPIDTATKVSSITGAPSDIMRAQNLKAINDVYNQDQQNDQATQDPYYGLKKLAMAGVVDPTIVAQMSAEMPFKQQQLGLSALQKQIEQNRLEQEMALQRDKLAEEQRHNRMQENISSGGIFGVGGQSQNAQQEQQETGDEFLSKLPKQVQDQVKALAEGRMQFPSGFALKSPYWQQMISAVSQYDPTFDAINYNARASTRKAFTSGNEAKSINALNTVSQHLADLQDAYENLNNSSYPIWNKLSNATGTALGKNTKTNFDTIVGPVAEEMTRAYRGAGGNESDIDRVIKTLNSDMSPQQATGAFKTLGDLLKGKINALEDQYKTGMGQAGKDANFISEKTAKRFKRMGVDLDNLPTSEEEQKPAEYDRQKSLLEEAKRRGLM